MELRVGDVMTKGVIYVRPNENIKRVAEIMKNNDIDSVIVIDKKHGLGMITDRDIINKIVAEGKNPNTITAAEVMTSPLITVAPHVDIDAAAKIMRDKNIRRLVVKQGDNIIGILTEFDLVRIEPAMHVLISEHSKFDISDITTITGTVSGICEVCGNYSENLQPVEGRLICEDCSSE
ncbi:MAG: CBS domain-containing protein [Candidatus Altiarchaeota archaeon]